jgi:hypothetical protein
MRVCGLSVSRGSVNEFEALVCRPETIWFGDQGRVVELSTLFAHLAKFLSVLALSIKDSGGDLAG